MLVAGGPRGADSAHAKHFRQITASSIYEKVTGVMLAC